MIEFVTVSSEDFIEALRTGTGLAELLAKALNVQAPNQSNCEAGCDCLANATAWMFDYGAMVHRSLAGQAVDARHRAPEVFQMLAAGTPLPVMPLERALCQAPVNELMLVAFALELLGPDGCLARFAKGWESFKPDPALYQTISPNAS